MYTKNDLKTFIRENCVNAKLTKFEFVSPEKFTVELKCGVEKEQTVEFYDDYSRDWIRRFSKFTATAWIVRSRFSKLKRLVFRKIYACNRSSFNKKKKADSETRNQECRAKVDFRVKFINRNTIKNDLFLKEGLNLTIFIDFSHSHKVQTPKSFNLLRNSSETDEIFEKYFDNGCSATVAKAYHELTLIDKYGEHCHEAFANATINPTIRHISYIHSKLKKDKTNGLNYQELMEQKKEHLKVIGVEIWYQTDFEISMVITPLMKRVIAEFGMQNILIDSTTIPHGPTAAFFFVPTKIGALPIACVIHGKCADGFYRSYQMVKTHLERERRETFKPKIITLSDFEEQNLVAKEFKAFLSKYALCNDVWRLLNDDDNKVERKKRHGVMLSVKTLLYAESNESAEKIYKELEQNEILQSNTKLKEYLENVWEKKDTWMFFEDDGWNCNLVEISIRLLKEFLVRKCKSFPGTLLIDIVSGILENHLRRIIISCVKKTKTAVIFTRFLDKAKIVLGFGSEVRRISTNEFRIELRPKPRKYLYFRTDTMFCDCVQGKRGSFCEHLSAIVNIIDCEMMKPPVLNENDKDVLTKIAGGDIEEEIKPKVGDDVKNFDVYDEANDDRDMTNDTDNLDTESIASSSKDDYFYLQVKTEKPDRFDPLEEKHADELEFIITENVPNDVPTASKSERKIKYEAALRAVNDEFRRLNRYFSENPNYSNLATMTRLARELSKIRPVEKVNLDNMHIKLNENRKRKHYECE